MKKDLKINKAFKRALCILLCVLFCFQALQFVSAATETDENISPITGKHDYNYKYSFDEKYKNYYLAATAEDDLANEINKIDPTIDELLDLYVKLSLYNVTREQAVTSMVRKFLADNYDLLPYMGDSLLTAFDPYGGYYLQTSTQQIFSKAYRGFGFTLEGKKKLEGYEYGCVIDEIYKDSPASNAGLKKGDEIIKIDDMSVEDLGLIAISNLFASVERAASITVRRNGKEITVKTGKATIYIPSVTFSADDKSKTATIAIADFVDDYMPDDLRNICLYLKENNYKNIIFDLRGNRGGDLIYMLEALNMFVPDKDVELCTMTDKDKNTETVYSTGDGLKFDKICILADNNSASATEIFALSLKEITGAVIIGETTYGKGVGQNYIELKNGDTAAITSFAIVSSKRTDYNKKGIEPDIKISREYIDVSAENKTFEQLNFVNCRDIKKDADNNAVLALNQRLARIGYISPEDVSSKCTDQTVRAVEIFQRYNNLTVGLSKIDYIFLNYMNAYLSLAPVNYEERDVQYECGAAYINKGINAAKNYAEEFANNDKTDKIDK